MVRTITGLFALAVVLPATLPAAAVPFGVAAGDTAVTRSPTPDPTPAVAGSIEGVLTVRERPRRRTVDRYGGQSAVRSVQQIPPVIYLEGRIGPRPEPETGVTMAQRDTAFAPPMLVVPVGTTITFPNHDPFFHNVFSYSSAGRFDLGRYPRGESKEVVFEEVGVVKIYCEVHEPMRSAVLVVENRYWARPDEAGRFRIDGVPAGTYTLVAWHADHGEVEREVRVPESGVVRVELEL